MQFKSIIFAAACLVALASATSIPSPPQADDVVVAGSIVTAVQVGDLTLVEGRAEEIEDTAGPKDSVEDFQPDIDMAITLPPPSSVACAICNSQINECSKKCATPGACDGTSNSCAQHMQDRH